MWGLKQYAENQALRDDNGATLSYAALAAEGDALADAVGDRCLVFSLCRNEIGSVLGYTAFLNHRIVPVLLNAHLDRALLDELLTKYCPAYLWVPADQADSFEDMETVHSAHGYCLLKTS